MPAQRKYPDELHERAVEAFISLTGCAGGHHLLAQLIY